MKSNIPLVGGLYVPQSSLEFVKDLAFDFELKGDFDEDSVEATLQLMNKILMPSLGIGRAIVKAGRSYELPYYDADVEIMEEEHVETSKLPGAIMEGKINYVQWFSSMNLSSFGLRVADVNFIDPNLPHIPTVFVPLESIDIGIAA